MTYPPPPGGYDPQQYHVSSQPPQPSDPYSQGYNAPPPPPPGYSQPPGQYPGQYPQTPPIGVQPGYPPGPSSSPLPPPIPPANQGSNLGIILGVIVGLVVILGVAAVLIVPGMLEDDEDNGSNEAGSETTSEDTEESPSADDGASPSDDEGEGEGTDEEGSSGGFDGWGTPVNSNEVDPNTPEGAAIAWEIAVDDGDIDALEALMCSNPTEDMTWELDYQKEYNTAENYDFLIWGMAKEEQDGQVEVWAGWTWDDTAPTSQTDIDEGGGQYYTAVEEDGTWKLCDTQY